MEFDGLAHWFITFLCNYNCHYCFFKSKPNKFFLSNDLIVNFWDKTNKVWKFKFTGGEPFLYPNFIDLCSKLSQKHIVSIDTNLSLSLPNLDDFIKRVVPQRVFLILAAMNERNESEMELFTKKARTLLDAGFNLNTNYVLHPTRYNTVDKTVDILKSNNISCTIKQFLGIHNGKSYRCLMKAIYSKNILIKRLKKISSNPKTILLCVVLAIIMLW